MTMVESCVGCRRFASLRCEYQLRWGWPSWSGRQTCDNPICTDCATRLADSNTYACPIHAELCVTMQPQSVP